MIKILLGILSIFIVVGYAFQLCDIQLKQRRVRTRNIILSSWVDPYQTITVNKEREKESELTVEQTPSPHVALPYT